MKLKEKIKSWIDKKRVQFAEWLAPSIKAEAYKKGYAEGHVDGAAVGFSSGHYEAYREMHLNLKIIHTIEEARCYVENVLDNESAALNVKSEIANISTEETDKMLKDVAKSMVHI